MRYLIAVFLVSGLVFVPSASASSCPGADPCPWTQFNSFGEVGAGEFRAPHGIGADGGGNLYVLEQDSERVQKLAASGASLATWGGPGSSDGKLDSPTDIAVAPGVGAEYVSDSRNKRIEKFDTSGKFISAWGWGVSDGSAAYQVCTKGCRAGLGGTGPGQFDWPTGIATDGVNVYVAEWSNKRIQKFDLAGAYVGEWAIPGGQNPEGVALAGGKVYVSTDSDVVWRFDQNGAPDNSWDGDGVTGSSGAGPGQFKYPEGVAVDGSGVYIADSGNNRVVKLSASGAFQSAWGSAGTGDAEFDGPSGILATGGAVWVTDTYNHRLQRFSQAGAHQLTVGTPPGAGDFYYPTDVATIPGGGAYVADWDGRDIQRLDASGTAVARWPGVGAPLSVTPTADGVYAFNMDDHVRQFDGAGNLVGEFGTSGSGLGQLAYPSGSARDADGNLYVAETNNDRVQKFSPAGVPLAVFGSKGTGDGQLLGPSDVAVDSAGNVYVSDMYNDRIEKFAPNGAFVAKWGSQGSGDGQLYRPRGLVLDAGGHLFVADTRNNRIVEFDTQGHFVTKWGALGAGPGEFNWPVGVSVGSGGAVWVADEDNHRIVRFCCPAAKGTVGGSGGGTTTPPPGGGGTASDTTAPRISLTGRAAQHKRVVRRRGLALRVGSNERATVRLRAVVSKRSARRLGVRSRTIGRAAADLGAAGSRGLRLRLSARARHALPRLRTVRIVIRASAADPSGNTASTAVAIRVER